MLCFSLFLVMCWSCGVAQTMPNLSQDFYEATCPNLFNTLHSLLQQAFNIEPRMAASLLRLHFHDCFVNGCDGSVLLDDTEAFSGEKTAIQNVNSLRGFEVIDAIKAAIENECPSTVSCADILALVARDSVVLAGGPSWSVVMGRRDATTASAEAAQRSIPAPNDSLSTLVSKFNAVGLSHMDMIALSGAHTIGKARCITFKNRLYNYSGVEEADPMLNPSYLNILQTTCPQGEDDNMLNALDPTTMDVFDNNYYINLKNGYGLLQSDQELYSTIDQPDTIPYVNTYANNQDLFFSAFSSSMIKLGNIMPLIEPYGEIRVNCRVANNEG